MSQRITHLDQKPTHISQLVLSTFPSADLDYVLALLLVPDGLHEPPEWLQAMVRIPHQSLGQFYENILAAVILSHPFEPPTQYRKDRFLSLPLTFTIHNKHLEHLLSRRTWYLFGNIANYIQFTADSPSYIERCRPILSTHILFEYVSNTRGILHVLPEGLQCDDQGNYRHQARSVCLPSEFTFQHTLYHPHFNFHHSQLKRHRTPTEQILAHARYPIGRSIGTFYRTASDQVVLVSPSDPSCLGRVLKEMELQQIDRLRCSLLQWKPGMDPCDLIWSVIHGLPNPDLRESYVLVPDQEMSYWSSILRHRHGVILLPFSELADVSSPPVHLLVIDEAHRLSSLILPTDCRHILGMSSDCSAHWKQMMQLCGIGQLPLPPLEPERDLCIYPDLSTTTCPRVILVDPDTRVRRLHTRLDDGPTLLRLCAGMSVDVGTVINGILITDEISTGTPYGNPSDECMICLSHVMYNPRVLPCQHVFCLVCIKRLLKRANGTCCPACRTPIEGPILQPSWVVTPPHSKPPVVYTYIQRVLEEHPEARLCLVTCFREVAERYQRLLDLPALLYGFGPSRPIQSTDRILICATGSYDRAVHAFCTDILILDVSVDRPAFTTIIQCSSRRIVLFLFRDCSDAELVNQWYKV